MQEALEKYPLRERFHVVSQLIIASDEPSVFYHALGCLLRGEKFRVVERED